MWDSSKKEKNIGKQTQRRSKLFEKQTSFGEYKYNLFIKAKVDVGIQFSSVFEVTYSNTTIKKENN